MDVDCELDSDLLTKFSCPGTTDRDVLINELQRLLDFQLNPSGCAFFLDMTVRSSLVRTLTLSEALLGGLCRSPV